MSLRKLAGLAAGFALATGLLGAGVGAAFTSSVTAQENIKVGTFQCLIVAATPGATIYGGGTSVVFNAPDIKSSAASSAPFSFTVESMGSIPASVSVAVTTAPASPFTALAPTPAGPVTLTQTQTQAFTGGLSWPVLNNDQLGLTYSVVYTASCGEVPAPWTLYGDGTVVDGAAQLMWSQSQPFGGVELAVPAGLTISGLNSLSANYKFTAGTCSNASPRFAIDVKNGATTGTIQVLLGPQWNNSVSVPCAGAAYMDSGNVLGAGYGADAVQIGGGYVAPGAWATFQASYGTYSVTGLRLVVDGWATPYITAQVDNIKVNGTTITF